MSTEEIVAAELVASDGAIDSPPRREYPLERPWNRRRLIHELARGERTQVALAEAYGVVQSAISAFQSRHLTEIQEVRADLENEFAGLWIASKRERIAVYQEDAEKLAEVEDPEALRIKHNILKAVAEELGQLPSKMNISVGAKTITYVIDGVDMEALR